MKEREGMWIVIIRVIGVGVVGGIGGRVGKGRVEKKIENGEVEGMGEVEEVDGECWGEEEVWEKERVVGGVRKKIE